MQRFILVGANLAKHGPTDIKQMTMIDPRPMEPAWVSDPEPLNELTWKIYRTRWNKEIKQNDTSVEEDQGTPSEFLCKVGKLFNSFDNECSLEVDATNLSPLIASKKHHFEYKEMPFDRTFWAINSSIIEEDGTCPWEMFAALDYAIAECLEFELDLSMYDPTP